MRTLFWIWLVGTVVVLLVFGLVMVRPELVPSAVPVERTVFLPGATTDGHYQIELECQTCHTDSFADQASLQEACVQCHGAELARADDSHPKPKFTDPRNADRVASLDARWCVTCHQEHRPEVTGTMGLSLPGDYCYRCHEDVGETRPTHVGLAFDSCASAGCHNFHDNRALYEDFLVEHRAEPWLLPSPHLPARDAAGERGGVRLGVADHDAPTGWSGEAEEIEAWAASAHARAGVNCSDCHAPGSTAWVDRPDLAVCADCHEAEHAGFLGGRHGMRSVVELSPMQPGWARQPMHPDVADRRVDCNSCHPAHAYDTVHAAATACLECHADEHTLAWERSPHGALWGREASGDAPANSGVSCASCHLPRVADASGGDRHRPAHNQNDYLRPNEKMIRASCLHCHGLGFSIDALADEQLVQANFDGRPSAAVESIHFATVLRWELEGKRSPFEAQEAQEEESTP